MSIISLTSSCNHNCGVIRKYIPKSNLKCRRYNWDRHVHVIWDQKENLEEQEANLREEMVDVMKTLLKGRKYIKQIKQIAQYSEDTEQIK